MKHSLFQRGEQIVPLRKEMNSHSTLPSCRRGSLSVQLECAHIELPWSADDYFGTISFLATSGRFHDLGGSCMVGPDETRILNPLVQVGAHCAALFLLPLESRCSILTEFHGKEATTATQSSRIHEDVEYPGK